MEELGAALATRGDDLVVERLRSREGLFVWRDDVNSRAQQRRVRLRHGRGGRVVDEHHIVVAPHERRERAREVRGRRGGGRRQGCTEESAPVGGGRDAVRIEDGRFGGGERDEAEGVREWESLELAHELGADQADANDGHGDGLGKQLGGRHRGRILRDSSTVGPDRLKISGRDILAQSRTSSIPDAVPARHSISLKFTRCDYPNARCWYIVS